MELFRQRLLRRFVRELTPGQLLPAAVAIFSLFAVLGPVIDILNGGRQNIWLLLASTAFSGALAIGYAFATIGGVRWALGSAIAESLFGGARAHGKQLDDQTLLLIRRT
jgi:hypothetical protein